MSSIRKNVKVTENYCRRCQRTLPSKEFYEAVDGGFIDSCGLMSVCKPCIQEMYDETFRNIQSVEKTLHKLCTSLNIKYSNEAVAAVKAHIDTMLEKGSNVNAIFGIYKQKLIAIKPNMDKTGFDDMSYEDVSVIFTDKTMNTKDAPIPPEVWEFWGKDLSREDVQFLEKEYTNFKQTYSSKTYAEVVLLKQICFIMLDIKYARANGDDAGKLLKEMRELMDSLQISPESASKIATGREVESFGLWIQDIEQNEPAQWLISDPRGDIYRDVTDVEGYFQKYFVRPLKNFITMSKDFNVEDYVSDENDYSLDQDETADFGLVDDGES